MEKNELKLIVFDMDGLLVDTEQVYFAGWHHALKEHNLAAPEGVIPSWVGKGMYEAMEELDQLTHDREWTLKIRESREQYFFRELEEGRVKTKPYARETLAKAKEHYTVGLATSTMGEKATRILETLDLLHYFDYPVFGSEVENLKPAPDLYLEVLNRSKMTAKEAIAVEDSITGTKAAGAAGLSTFLVPDSNFPFDQKSVPNTVVKVGKDLRIVLDFLQ